MTASLKVIALIAVTGASLISLNAAEAERIGGPKGGRLLENSEPQAEFFLESDHTVTITFYDADLHAVPASGQSVTVIANAADGKQVLDFEKEDDVLKSKAALPEGDGYNLVVQLRQTADAKPQNYRFKLETHTCAECQRAEYACICDE